MRTTSHAYHLQAANALLERVPSGRAYHLHTPASLAALDLELLEAGRTLSPYVRRGRQIGRRTAPDETRVVRHEITAARQRIRSALHRTSGTPTSPVQAPGTASMWGRCGRFEREIADITADHAAAQSVLGAGSMVTVVGGGQFRTMTELNKEAARLLKRLRRHRRTLRTYFKRYQNKLHSSYTDADTLDRVEDKVKYLNGLAADLTTALQTSVQRTEPIFGVKRTWTHESVLARFRKLEQLPTKRECNANPAIPAYTTLYRLFGKNPLTALDKLLKTK